MDRNTWRERMVETLLEEELGAKRCPDLTASVMAAVQGQKRAAQPDQSHENKKGSTGRAVVIGRIGSQWKWGAAIAAVLVLGLSVALGVYVMQTPAYPGIQVTGDLFADNRNSSGDFKRGDVFRTISGGTGTLKLGGYVEVEVAKESEVQWRGEPNAEVVELIRGSIVNRVNKDRQGTYEVVTPIGAVKTVGTVFEVQIIEEGEADMKIQSMIVKVLVGAVLVTGGFGEELVQAGDEKKFKDQNQHKQLVKKIAEEEKHNGLQLKAKSGTLTGIVQAKELNRFFLQTPQYKLPIAFRAQWKGGTRKEGGGFDKQVLNQIRSLKRGDKVSVKYVFDERPRALEIKKLGRASEAEMKILEEMEKKNDIRPAGSDVNQQRDKLDKKRGRDHEIKNEEVVTLKRDARAEIRRINEKEKHNGMQLLKMKEGILVGEVVEVDGNRVWLRSSGFDGEVAFAPRWISKTATWKGGLDTRTQKAVKGLKRGDRIRFSWSFDERPRIIWLKKVNETQPNVGDGAP